MLHLEKRRCCLWNGASSRALSFDPSNHVLLPSRPYPPRTPMSFLGAVLPASLRPSSSSASPAGSRSTSPGLAHLPSSFVNGASPVKGGPPRKSSGIRSAVDLENLSQGGTFPAFPFPALRSPAGKRGEELELGAAGAQRSSRSRWGKMKVANVVYVALFWLLVIAWLRALGGYGFEDE